MRKKQVKKTNFIFRLTAEEKKFIHDQAEAAGLPASEYVRALALGYEIRTSTDAAVLNELRRLGGLCKHLYNEGMDPVATGRALSALGHAADRLAPR
ncbi:MobB mobilization protein [Desulfovibrio sp. G11]|nr:MobB mobilization protein [Desulfovibrio sp. G11]